MHQMKMLNSSVLPRHWCVSQAWLLMHHVAKNKVYAYLIHIRFDGAPNSIIKLVLGPATVALVMSVFQISTVLNPSKSLTLSGCCIFFQF